MTRPDPRRKFHTTHFAAIPEWVLYSSVSDEAKLAYAYLDRIAGNDTDNADELWPSPEMLAERMSKSARAVRGYVKELRDIDAITDVRRRRYASTVWRLRRDPPSLIQDGKKLPSSDDPGWQETAGSGLQDGKKLPDTFSLETPSNRVTTPLRRERVPDAERLCNLLADLVQANGSKRPRVTQRWLDEADRVIRLDERTPEQVEKAIRWCQGNTFWRGAVMSMPKLREQFDRLRLEAKREQDELARRRNGHRPTFDPNRGVDTDRESPSGRIIL